MITGQLKAASILAVVATLLSAGLAAALPAAAATRAPTVTAVRANTGRTAGGEHVTIYGSGLTGVTAVSFSGHRATAINRKSSTMLVVTTPSHYAYTVDVGVITTHGNSAIRTADRFTYIAPPTVNSVAPRDARMAGGQHIYVYGHNFVGVTGVRFGSTPATAVRTLSSTTLLANSPKHVDGLVDVRVLTRYGTSSVAALDRFRYMRPPRITAITPNSGSTGSGDMVTISGTDFLGVDRIYFGTALSPYFVVTSSSKISARPPWHAASSVSVRVSGEYGLSAESTATRFTYYVAPLSAVIVETTTDTSVGLAWSSRSGDPADFTGTMIRRSTGVTAPRTITDGTLVANLPASAQTYTDAGLAPGTTYSYAAFAHNATAFSAGVTATAQTKSFTWGSATLVQHPQGGLQAVTCPSVTFCAAVDYHGNIVTFDGAQWSAPTTIDGNGQMKAISCASAAFCAATDQNGNVLVRTAAGWSDPQRIDGTNWIPYIACPSASTCVAMDGRGSALTFNGTRWSAPISVLPNDAPNHVTGLSCPSATFCEAVDTLGRATTYNGTTWSSPSVIDKSNGLVSVSCPTTSWCMAVDSAGDTVTYAAGTWSSSATTHLADASALLSCPTTDFCVDLASSGVAASYDGSTWSTFRHGLDNSYWAGLACASPTLCLAVDLEDPSSMFDGTSWTDVTGIDPVRTGVSNLSCAGPAFCAAILGSQVATSDGDTWTAPETISSHTLFDVSCASPTFCLTVDRSGAAWAYNGSAWSAVAPGDGAVDTPTYVSCPTATFCVTVNRLGQIASYDGTNWTRDEVGLPFTDVSCASTTMCVAIDAQGSAIVYDGQTWSAPVQIDSEGSPDAVSCSSPTRCMAVDTSGYAVTYGGTTWSMPTQAGPAWDDLQDVSCVSSTNCTAVDPNGTISYNGTGWSTWTPLGPAYDGGDSGRSVSCPGAGRCVIGGADGNVWVGTP